MSDDEGRSFAPFWGAFLALLVLVASVLIASKYIFSGASPSVYAVGRSGIEFSVASTFQTIGFLTAFALSIIVYLTILTQTQNRTMVFKKTSELLKSRDFFLHLFDESPVPYMMVDIDGAINLSNKAALRLFGRTREELSEYKFHQLHAEEYYVDSRQIFEKFIRGVATSDFELQVVRKDKTKRWVRLSALPFRTMGGSGKGGVVSLFDITEQKAIDKVKTEFVSLASHQLRTPLSAMKWYGEMVLNSKDPLTEKQRTHIEKIYKGNERMIDLVNLLLSASRLELGNLTIDIQNIDPLEIIKTILEELRIGIESKNLQLVENYDGDNTNFYSDKKLLMMILQNLLSNAVKYTNEDGVVKVSLLFTNEQLQITVEDSGLGIPEDQQASIFTKMFRADNARLSNTDGTGLGLYIVKEAVEALGGEIGFTSKENEGTIFTASIPNGTHGSVLLP